MKILKQIFLVMFLLSITVTTFSQSTFAVRGRSMDFVPRPRLLSPSTEEVDLSGKEKLEFKWSPHERVRAGSGSRYFDFRLYKGYQMVEANLLLKERVPGNKHTISLDAGLFEDGQVYTWSLRRVYKGIGKSDRSINTFKIIK